MSKAQQLLEEVRKRKEAEAAAAAAGDTGTSALDELMGGITGLDEPEPAAGEEEVTTDGNPEPAQDEGFITIVPEAPTQTGIKVEVENAPAVTEQAPATEAQPAPEPAPAPKARRQTKQTPKVTETPTAPEQNPAPATDAPMTLAQKRTLEEIEAGRRLLASRHG